VSRLLELQRALAADPMVRAVEPLRVIDGDTFVCQVDLGFYTWSRQSCRLAGLNCAELNEPGGPETRTELQQLLGLGPVVVRSVAVDKFSGRFDAEVLAGPPWVSTARRST
jgi:endonuclease YncB( thermonuclease family)